MVKPVETFPPRGRDDASWRIKLYKLRLQSTDEPSNAEAAPELRPRMAWTGKEDAHGTLRAAGSRV
jgi:hypothetical protein